jgi:hypothetical protein
MKVAGSGGEDFEADWDTDFVRISLDADVPSLEDHHPRPCR